MTKEELLRRQIDQRLNQLSYDQLLQIDRLLIELPSPQRDSAAISQKPQKAWPHAPLHRLSEHGTFFVTAGTFEKKHFFRDETNLDFLESKLLELAAHYGWHLEAWAVFSNHYHFVGHSNLESGKLNLFLGHLHSVTGREVNERDGLPERTVWFNFWETQLTFEKSYFARLNYVHQNAVKHRLVKVASEYPWCSAAWFERMATPAQVKTIYGFRIDRVNVADDY